MWPPLLLGDSGGSLESAAEEYALQVPKDYVVLGCKQGGWWTGHYSGARK